MADTKHYADRDPIALGQHYSNHVRAMTVEKLHSKSAIAAELAYRDQEIERLTNALLTIAQARAGTIATEVGAFAIKAIANWRQN